MSSSTTQTTLNRREIYRQTDRILNANFLHFIPISLLFLPLTFSAAAAIQFYFSSFFEFIDDDTYIDPTTTLLIKTIISSFQSLFSPKSLITVLAFTFFVILSTVAGIALITYTTNQAIYLKHITFSSTIKSLSYSYIPLLSTIIAGLIKLILISLLLTLSPIAITEANKALGFPFDLPIFLIFLVNSIVFFVLVVFFITIWGSAPAIAVLELKSGFEPLRQSANQSTEFRSHSFFILFSYGYFIGLTMFFISGFSPIFGRTTTNWISILNVCFVCLHSSQMILRYVVANTVLYIQCKVACGEESVKTAMEGEVSGEYVSVAVNHEGDNVSDEEPKVEGCGGYTCILWVSYLLWILTM